MYSGLHRGIMESLSYTIKRRRLGEKLCYMLSVASICLLTYCVTSAQYIIPYIFTVTVPLLSYMCMLMQGKLTILHLCHLVNAVLLIFIWFMPQNATLFYFVFINSNGPIIWSQIALGNALVLHMTSHMTYVFIHTLPALLCSVIRWYPKDTSRVWHQEFVLESSELSHFWILAVSFAFYRLHRECHSALLHWLFPTEQKGDILSFLLNKPNSMICRLLMMFGPKHAQLVFNLFDSLYCLILLLLSMLMYNSFLWCCIFTGLILLLTTFNGAVFYLDVFSAKDREWYLRSINAGKEKKG